MRIPSRQGWGDFHGDIGISREQASSSGRVSLGLSVMFPTFLLLRAGSEPVLFHLLPLGVVKLSLRAELEYVKYVTVTSTSGFGLGCHTKDAFP